MTKIDAYESVDGRVSIAKDDYCALRSALDIERGRVATLAESLEPLAALGGEWHDRMPDSRTLYHVGHGEYDACITIGDVRRARVAIDALREEKGL